MISNKALQQQKRKKARSILRQHYDKYDPESSTTDILTDLMHASAVSGVNFDNCLRIARGHFEEETNAG